MIEIRSSSIPSRIRKAGAVIVLAMAAVVFWEQVVVPELEEFLVVNAPLEHADALVVMAGEIPVRLQAAARAYLSGKADKILLTNDGILGGWSEEKQRNLYQVEWAEEELLKMKVPENAIVKLAYSSSGSVHDALNTRSAVMKRGIRSITVVTSDYHTRRSFWIFERVFRGLPVKIGVYSADSGMGRKSELNKSLILVYEMTKYLYYTFRYSDM